MTPLDEEAAALLERLAPIKHISCFGAQLMESALVKKQEGKHYSRQGYALFAGKHLKRLERQGLAVQSWEGWRPASPKTRSPHGAV